MRHPVARYLLQGVNYALFAAVVWYFSVAPAVEVLAPDEGVITVAFSHAGELREPCRKLSAEELGQLAQNMQVPMECPRERSPVGVRMTLDDRVIMDTVLKAPGLYEDGGVDIFHSARVSAGDYRLDIAMSDSVRNPGVRHRLEREISVRPGQIVLVRFQPERGFLVED